MFDKDIIKMLPEKQRIQFGDVVVASLNLIPYAGGTIASLISTHTNSKRINKICESIKLLYEKIKENDIKVENILKEEEVIELLEKTLNEIAKSSHKKKIKYLQNALIKSFTNKDITFRKKEFYLNILTNRSIGEIQLLNVIYKDDDTFIKRIYTQKQEPPSDDSHLNFINRLQDANCIGINYKEGEVKYVKGNIALKEYLESIFNKTETGVLAGIIFTLDSKGITSIKDNLTDTTVKEIIMKYTDVFKDTDSTIFNIPTYNSNMHIDQNQRTGTPIKNSQTEFGIDFIDYIDSQT